MRRLLPALLVGCMQTAAAFHQKSRCESRFQRSNGEGEDSHASGRASNARGSRGRCNIDSGLLLAPYLSGCAGAGGRERPPAIGASLGARNCSSSAVHRLHSVVRPARPVPKAQPVEHRLVLGCRCCRPSCHPLPAGDSQLDCRVKHATAMDQVRALARRYHRYARYCLVSMAVERNAPRSTSAHVANGKQPRSVQARLQQRGQRSAACVAVVAHVSDLPAGGVRNRKVVGADAYTADPRACGLGADAADRLVKAQRDGSISNLRRQSHPILGQ